MNTAEAKITKKNTWSNKELIRNQILPLFGLVAAVIIFTVITKGAFLATSNLKLLLNQSLTLILTATGAAFIYSHGSIDVSLANACMLGCIAAVNVANATGSILLSAIVCVAVCVFFAIVVALISVNLHIRPFPAALCISFICMGIAGELLTTGEVLMPIALARQVDVPWIKIVALIVSVVVCYLLYEHTKIGPFNRMMGGNETAVALSGINTKKYKIIAFLIRGIMLGIAAFFLICRVSTATTTTGAGLHMDVMLAVILGGMSIRGGPSSRITAPIIGAITTYVLSNGFVLCGVNAYYVELFKGIIFLIVILVVFPRKKGGTLPD